MAQTAPDRQNNSLERLLWKDFLGLLKRNSASQTFEERPEVFNSQIRQARKGFACLLPSQILSLVVPALVARCPRRPDRAARRAAAKWELAPKPRGPARERLPYRIAPARTVHWAPTAGSSHPPAHRGAHSPGGNEPAGSIEQILRLLVSVEEVRSRKHQRSAVRCARLRL